MSPPDSPREPPDQIKRPPLKLVPPTANIQTNAALKHIVCKAILPFNNMDQSFDFYKHVLQPALCDIFEQFPYYWQVKVIDTTDIGITTGMNEKEKDAEVYIVDISDENPDMIFELGKLQDKKEKGSLVFALCRQGSRNRLASRKDVQVIYYPRYQQESPDDTDYTIKKVKDVLVQSFHREDIRKINATERLHYLSALVLSENCSIRMEVADACTNLFKTMETFVDMKAREISQQLLRDWNLRVGTEIIIGWQRGIRKLLRDVMK